MFENCGQLTSLDLSNFYTKKVLYMDKLFYNCSSLETLIINFNTTRVNRMSYMFGLCTSLKSLNIRHLELINVMILLGYLKMIQI